MSKIQNENVKSEAELIADGGTKDQLINDTKIYVTGNSINKTLDDAIVDGDIGGGGADIGYITGDNRNFEGSIGDYVTYVDAAGTIPVDGTGGTANITFTTQTSNVLEGAQSARLAKDAADRQGEGVSLDLSIDAKDQAQLLYLSFAKQMSANYSDDDIKIVGYDVTNSNIERARIGEDLKAGKGYHIARFQIPATCDDFRIIFHVSSTNALAYDVDIDDVQFARIPMSFGNYSNKEIIDLTGSGDFTGGEILVTRVGDQVTLSVTSTVTFSSTTNADSATGILPSWATPSTLQQNVFEIGSQIFRIRANSDGSIGFFFRNYSGAGSNATIAVGGSITYSIDDELNPVQQSQTFSNVPARAKAINVGVFPTSYSAGFNKISLQAPVYDTVGMQDVANNRMIIKKKSNYVINGKVEIAGGSIPTDGFFVTIFINGVEVPEARGNRSQTTAVGSELRSSQIVFESDLNVNDIVELYINVPSAASIQQYSRGFLSVYESSGQSGTLLERPEVTAVYNANAGQAVISGNVIDFETKVIDTHNAVTTGSSWQFRAPYTGNYTVDPQIYTNGVTATAGQFFGFDVFINGTDRVMRNFDYDEDSVNSRPLMTNTSKIIPMNEGDTLDVIFSENIPAVNLSSQDICYISITLNK